VLEILMKKNRTIQAAYLPAGAALVLSGVLLTASCAQDEPPESAVDRRSEAAMDMRKSALEQKGLERVDLESGTAVTGEVPEDILEKAYAALESDRGGSRDDFQMLRGEQAHWTDGSLGCPEPGATYTDAPVTGYWVVFSYQGKEYDYRGNAGGYFRRCPVPSFPSRSGPKM
jgi:hypothetical protein